MIGEPSTWVEIYRSPAQKQCEEHALVLQAMDVVHGILRAERAYLLVVHPQDAARATEEIARYQRENTGWPPREVYDTRISDGVRGVIVYGGLMILFFFFEKRGAYGLDWWEQGTSRAARIQDGEWWRTLTSLTLHADVNHLAGNIVFGCMFGVILAQSLGSGLAWLATLAAGGLGNWINAYIQDRGHNSLGASTAVFGALGVQVAYEWMRRRELRYRRMRRWAPLVMGCVMLGYLGTAGERTDVMAHCTGFLSGLALGFGLGFFRARVRFAPKTQLLLGGATLAVIGLAWLLAFTVK